jgi:hypothetical protein
MVCAVLGDFLMQGNEAQVKRLVETRVQVGQEARVAVAVLDEIGARHSGYDPGIRSLSFLKKNASQRGFVARHVQGVIGLDENGRVSTVDVWISYTGP